MLRSFIGSVVLLLLAVITRTEASYKRAAIFFVAAVVDGIGAVFLMKLFSVSYSEFLSLNHRNGMLLFSLFSLVALVLGALVQLAYAYNLSRTESGRD
jgi:hypothetical protein